MPARLAGIAACALRDQAQARRLPGLCRQLQPPPLAQVKRAGDLYHHHGHRTVPQRLFGNSKRVGLTLRPRDQNTRGIADRREADRIRRSGLPALAHPQHRPLALRTDDSGKSGHTRPTGFMHAGRTQGRRRSGCLGHGHGQQYGVMDGIIKQHRRKSGKIGASGHPAGAVFEPCDQRGQSGYDTLRIGAARGEPGNGADRLFGGIAPQGGAGADTRHGGAGRTDLDGGGFQLWMTMAITRARP